MGPLRRILLGSGQLPDDLRATVTAEETLVLEEDLAGSVTYHHLRAPGTRANWRKEAACGAIAVTGRRLAVWAGGFKHIDVPHDHPLRPGITVTAEQANRISFTYDAGAANPSRSGKVEVRLRTPQAHLIADLLSRLAAGNNS